MPTTTRPRRSKPAKAARRQSPEVQAGGRPYRPDVGALEACASTCSAAFAYCLTLGGDHVEEHHLKSLVDGIDVCQAAASMVSRGSPYGEELLALCARACRDVAESCARFPADDHMRACATAARLAEEWCRR